MDVSLPECVNTVTLCRYITAFLLLTSTGTLCSPLGTNNDCTRKLQMTCGTEYDALSEHTGTDVCSYLSKTVLCVACKVESCKDTLMASVPVYNQAPYKCELSQEYIGLLQGQLQYRAMCPSGSGTTQPPETSTHTSEPQNSQLGGNDTSGQAPVSLGNLLVVLSTITSVQLVLR